MPYCPTCHGQFAEGQFCPKDGTHLQPDAHAEGEAEDALLGQVVAERFRVLSRLGAGGMGTVYRAEHIYIKKIVALKLLRPEITANPEAITRFQREALAASTIGHENIVRIDDFGRLPDGQVYLTMEFIDGCALSEVLRQAPLTLEQVLDVALQTCQGLAAAHAKGIVHRDMKPENIFISRADGQVKILDFGIAKVIRSDENTNLTKTGAVFGTPNYMAPEQALGRRVDHRADIYSIGVILYEMLTGQLPFRSDSFIAILAQHVTEPPVPPRTAAPERNIPDDLEAVTLRAMSKETALRFRDMRELIEALLEVRRRALGDVPMRSSLRLAQVPEPAVSLVFPGDSVVTAHEGPSRVTATAGELLAFTPATAPGRATGRSRRLLIGLATVVVLAAAAAGGLMLLKRPSVDAGGRMAAHAGMAAADSSPPAAKKTPAPALIEVIVDTEPNGAAIERDGVQLGTTPDVVKVPAGVKTTFQLRLAGYQPTTIDVLALRSEKKIVKLTKIGTKGRDHEVVTQKVAGKVDRDEIKRKAGKRTKKPRRAGGSDGDHGSDHSGGEPIDPY